MTDLNIADLNIGVVGIPGKWSTETLADSIETRTGRRIVVDMGRVELDLAAGRLLHGDKDLCTLDGLIVKKISATYSPATLDRLEMLRVAEACGVRVFSPATNILRLIDRLRPLPRAPLLRRLRMAQSWNSRRATQIMAVAACTWNAVGTSAIGTK